MAAKRFGKTKFMISFTQTNLWAELNEYVNEMKPYKFDHGNISCLFGYDLKDASITSFGGPVVPPDSSLSEFSEFINKLVANTKSIYKVNFRALFPLRQWSTDYEQELIKVGFKKEEWKTFIIDLSISEENLLKNFEHATRKGIKKAQNLGVQITKCHSFEEYYADFLIPYLKATNRPTKEKSFYKKAWELDSGGYYGYWIAKNFEGTPLGFLGSYRYDNVAMEIMSALTSLAWQQKIPVQDLMHWEIIKHHKILGDLYFDLAGFNPNPISEKEKNIKRFKEKWGGQVYDTSSYTLDRRPFIKRIFDNLMQRIHV